MILEMSCSKRKFQIKVFYSLSGLNERDKEKLPTKVTFLMIASSYQSDFSIFQKNEGSIPMMLDFSNTKFYRNNSSG